MTQTASPTDTSTVFTLREELDAAREKIANLEIALGTSRKIAMAVGIVMERYRIKEDEAFDVLRAISQNAHRKIRDLAEDVVFTGQLPGSAA